MSQGSLATGAWKATFYWHRLDEELWEVLE